jgi:pimeloyl-ACP methyl ester carboxylesterase
MKFDRAIVTYGNPSNPPILFLHGIRLGGKIWEPHAQELANRFYVITPDLPGHGALADLPFEIPVYDAMLAYIAESVVSRPPLVVGYSLGGYVAMRYATDLPQRTAGLLLAGCCADITGGRQLAYDVSIALAAQLPPAAVDRILTMLFRLTLPKKVADVIIPFRFDQRVFESSRATATGIAYSERLAEYPHPVLIVNGEWDVLFRADEQKYARAAQAPVLIVRNSDHVAPFRRPKEFSTIVARFAAQVFGTEWTPPAGRLS